MRLKYVMPHFCCTKRFVSQDKKEKNFDFFDKNLQPKSFAFSLNVCFTKKQNFIFSEGKNVRKIYDHLGCYCVFFCFE